MLLHPAFTVLIATLLMILTRKKVIFFQIIALIYPLIAGFILFSIPESGLFSLAQINFLFYYGELEKLIALAFLIVLLSANIYALGQARKVEIILGSAYGGFSLICLFANDLLSLFIALELMMITSTMIIFIGGYKTSLTYASRYFFTHLFSSNLIMVGLAYLMCQHQIITVTALPDILKQISYSNLTIYFMLLGMIINIAAFPFSGWMVNYYSKASPTGFLYLISFTTKTSIILLLKLFPALFALRYIGAMMIIYATFRAKRENNIFSLLCLLSIMAMGLMMIGISVGSEKALLITGFYLFIHIIYKLILSLVAANLADQAKIINCDQLMKIKNSYLLFSALMAIAIMVNIPLSATFYLKYTLSNLIEDEFIKYIIMFLAFLSCYVLPWQQYLQARKSLNLKLTYYAKISLLIPNIILIMVGFFWYYIPFLNKLINNSMASMLQFNLVKQLIILTLALFAAYYFTIRRNNNSSFSLLSDFSDVFMNLSARNSDSKLLNKVIVRENWKITNFIEYLWQKIAKYHNQTSAIFVIFSFLLLILITFYNYY